MGLDTAFGLLDRRRLGAVGAAVLVLLLAACGSPKITAPKGKDIPVDTPDMVALKRTAGLTNCPTPQTTKGGLPKVTLKCLGGGPSVDLSTLKGPLILNVWSSTCKPCRKEMPELGDFYRQHGAQVPIIGIDIEDTYPGVALQQAAKRKATYPQLFDFWGDIQETKQLHVPGTPEFIFLKPDGSISRQAGGLTSYDEVVAMVNQQLGLHLS